MDRLSNILMSGLGLLLSAPVSGIITIGVLSTMGRPVFFRQTRPGKDGRPFEMIKFRTMNDGTEDDNMRMTSFGKFIRTTSLDELPELWNVLKGEMNIVGPRPLLMEYLPLYSSEQWRRHEVKPGITGWAQINGRNSISWETKFQLDVWYVDNRSCRLDLYIIGMTVLKVFRREGISSAGQATMEAFRGTQNV